MAETKVVTLDVNSNIDQTAKSVGSLKAQLREAQNEVNALSDKFGATSQEAVNAAKKASELKDRIGDAKALTDAFNPDAKFKAVSSSLAGVAGGFSAVTGAMGILGAESKQTEEMILKVQSAMAIASGLQQLGESADAFKQMKAVAIDAFKGIKAAIGSTGIGLLVIALGTIYAYWDDIKEAVSGVSEEQKKLTEQSKLNNATEEEKLKNLNAQDNILRLQGKSEKEILAIKQEQINKAIKAKEIFISNQIEENKQAVEGAKRNYELLKSYIDFVSAPLRFLYKTGAESINGIIDLLNKIPGINIKNKLDETIGDKAADYLAKLGFDSDQVKAEGEKSVKEANDALIKLKNDKAGIQITINDIDKKAAKDAELTEEEKLKALKKLNEKYNDEIANSDINIDTTQLQNLDNKIQEKRDFNQQMLDEQQQFELQNAQIIYDSEEAQKQRRQAAFNQKLEDFKNVTNAIGSIAQSGEDLLTAVQSTGIARGKAGQTALKALTLVQIGADSAAAFSKMMAGTEASAAGAASTAGPAAPAVYLATKIGFYASGAATILSNIARAKKLLSGGDGGAGVSTPSSAGTSAPAAPSFNVVGNGGTNQIAQVMNKQGVAPFQAYVVASNVTSAQSLNRNIVSNATLG